MWPCIIETFDIYCIIFLKNIVYSAKFNFHIIYYNFFDLTTIRWYNYSCLMYYIRLNKHLRFREGQLHYYFEWSLAEQLPRATSMNLWGLTNWYLNTNFLISFQHDILLRQLVKTNNSLNHLSVTISTTLLSASSYTENYYKIICFLVYRRTDRPGNTNTFPESSGYSGNFGIHLIYVAITWLLVFSVISLSNTLETATDRLPLTNRRVGLWVDIHFSNVTVSCNVM